MSTESVVGQTSSAGRRPLLARLNRSLDTSSRGAETVRRVLGALFFVYAVTLTVASLARGDVPSWGYLIMAMLAAALFGGRGGPFVRAWAPVVLGVFAYIFAGTFAEKIDFPVHYMPQIDMDKLIGLGQLPTTWLQDHLYTGHTGPLELFTVVMYISHFFVPLLLGFYLWWTRRSEAFTTLMFGILTVSILGEITFILAPTAPPWMAADHGLIPPVHHVIKETLGNLGLSSAAELKDRPGTYNVVAAMPSLHAAWPLIGYFVARYYGLPRWLRVGQLLIFAGVLFAIVYGGEHYVADALVGALYAWVAWRIVIWLLGKRASRREQRESEPVPGTPRLAKTYTFVRRSHADG
jgi:hypothetical protein